MAKRKQQPPSETGTVAWAGRIERDILRDIKLHATRNRRSIGGQINVALDEWLRMIKNLSSEPIRKGEYVANSGKIGGITDRVDLRENSSLGTSEPPPRIAAQARAKAPAIPDEVAREIVDEDAGWEGSDPKTLLGGTKVRI
jgi:hypothetical protein